MEVIQQVPDADRTCRAAPSTSGGAGPPAGDATSSRAVPSSSGVRASEEAAAAASSSLPGAAPAAAHSNDLPAPRFNYFDESRRRALFERGRAHDV